MCCSFTGPTKMTDAWEAKRTLMRFKGADHIKKVFSKTQHLSDSDMEDLCYPDFNETRPKQLLYFAHNRILIDQQKWPQKWPLLLVVSAKRRYLDSMSLWPYKWIMQPLGMAFCHSLWLICYWILLRNGLILSWITSLLAQGSASFLKKVKRWRSDRFLWSDQIKASDQIRQPKLVSSF